MKVGFDNWWLIWTASKPGGRGCVRQEMVPVNTQSLLPITCTIHAHCKSYHRSTLHWPTMKVGSIICLLNCWHVCATSLVADKVVQTDWCQVCSPQLHNVWTLWELCCPQGSSRLLAQRPNMTVCAIVYCVVTKQTTDLPKTGTACLWSGYCRSKLCSSH